MPYCHSCGKNVSATAKFCRSCGASQEEEMEAAAVPPLPAEETACPACSAPVLSGDKFCGSCGGRVSSFGRRTPRVIVKEESPVPVNRVCGTCGVPAPPGIKFCGSCGTPAGVAEPGEGSHLPPPQASPSPYACPACSSPLAGHEKFCGICGSRIVGTRGGTVQEPAIQMYCGTCGESVGEKTKYCGLCGAPVASLASAVPQDPESVLGVIPGVRKPKLLGIASDTFTLIVTNQRMIFALLTHPESAHATMDANNPAGHGSRYETLPPDLALGENSGNFAIGNYEITAITLQPAGSKDPAPEEQEFHMTILSGSGSYNLEISADEHAVALLRKAYGDRVSVPPGLFPAGQEPFL